VKVTVKIINNIGYIKLGSIGVGFGSLSRAAKIRDSLKLADFPTSLPEDQWRSLTAYRIEDVNITK
jgi:hypothetical protein